MTLLKKKLKNGITVLMEHRNLPVVSLSITNRFGGAHEESEIKGIAHFMEHLVFTGTKTRTHEDISREIEKKGGLLNAFTAHEATSFWFKLPSEHLFSGLDILADILNNTKFDPEKFEKEKKVVLEEIKMYHDDPRTSVFEQIERNLYEKPFGDLIIGSPQTVSSLKREFVADYFSKKYSPENYIVTIVGDADFEKVCNYLEKAFKPKNQKKSEIIPIKKKVSKTVEERPGIDQAQYVFAIHLPLPKTKEFIAWEVLDAYLANGMSSRLFLEIREKLGLAYVVKSEIASEKNYSHYIIYAGTTKEAIPKIEKIILSEFQKIKNMTQKDLEEAKERLIGLRKVSSEESVSVMNELMMSEFSTSAEDYYKYEKKVNAVTLEEIKKLAKIGEFSTAAIIPK